MTRLLTDVTVAALYERRSPFSGDVTRRSQTAATEESKIRCLNFDDARLALLDLAVVHENLELSHRSSSY
jgi:hypothetical protein